MMSSLAPCIPCPVMGEGRVRSACGWCCSLTTGFDHRIGHFRPLRMVTTVREGHLYLRLGRFGLDKRLLGWPTP